MAYKEYKKILKQEYIDNNPSFNRNLDDFLKEYKDIKIEHIITHKPYHITIIYSKLIEVK